ncbi:response regulator transcription factor [Streptomyces sp. BI20]|uniref:response regulator transcription factor n=1 Tax=Streptomyces sp. BI20 TaxID=3403460 RepID=UPI003C72327F
MPSVLVVDDQRLTRTGIAAILRAAPGIDVVGEADDGERAVAMAVELRPDVVLMDIRMPGVGGIEATRRILAAAVWPAPRILVLTTFDEDAHVRDALRAGAVGFLLKTTPPERLVAAVHTVHAGEMLFSSNVLRALVDGAPDPARPPTPAAAAVRTAGAPVQGPDLDVLTPREREVLALVGAGLTNTQIADRLVLSVATVKSYVHQCMSKLDLATRAQAVVLAHRAGLAGPHLG